IYKIKMAEQTHVFQVEMTCSGCSGAVERILKKTPDIISSKIDLENKKVEVTTTKSQSEMEEILKKSGKEVKYIGAT
ncbi:unnamed protein product, partial [Didymodactylos carnosus]